MVTGLENRWEVYVWNLTMQAVHPYACPTLIHCAVSSVSSVAAAAGGEVMRARP